MIPDSLSNLIESFKCLPGIGEKTAERLAFAVLSLEKEQVDLFSNSLIDVFNNIKRCSICNSYSETNVCSICEGSCRDSKILCVVEDPKNIFLFEKVGLFKGYYHVLNGLISPLDGVNPEDVGIDKLLDRIENGNFEEVLFAFKPSIEGETTALYIKKILDGLNIKVTKLANGLPIGADIEYVDSLTLERALNDRREIM